MKIALGSEQETRTNLLEAFKKKYITAEELSQALTLARRAIGAAVRMKNYLSSTDTPPPKPWRPRDHDSDPSP
jgi:hypothetical protein